MLPLGSGSPAAFLPPLGSLTHPHLGPSGPHPSGSPRVRLTLCQASGKIPKSSSNLSPHAGAGGNGCNPGNRCCPPHWLRRGLRERGARRSRRQGTESPSAPTSDSTFLSSRGRLVSRGVGVLKVPTLGAPEKPLRTQCLYSESLSSKDRDSEWTEHLRCPQSPVGTQRLWTRRSLRTSSFEVRSMDQHHQHHKCSAPGPSTAGTDGHLDEIPRSLLQLTSAFTPLGEQMARPRCRKGKDLASHMVRLWRVRTKAQAESSRPDLGSSSILP